MIAENPYIKQFPDLMAGKTVLYVHGFGSSGQSGTVNRLRTVMPQARIVAPDLPVHPHEAIALLHELCDREHPDLIVGTSMGGMYTEQLYGFDRICVNPAMEMAETMKAHGMTGQQTFQNPRQDGVQEFMVTKTLVKEYKEVTEQRFAPQSATAEEQQRVYGLFGDADTTVDTYDLFHGHYPQAAHFHGEHRMNDKSFMHSVVPVIRWIDDRQEGRQRPIIYIGIETLADSYLKPASSVMKAVRLLIEHYQVFFVGDDDGPLKGREASSAAETTATATAAQPTASQWLTEHVNIPAWRHTVFTYRRDLLYGDYLISGRKEGDTMATLIAYGSDTFKTWEDIIDYFARLGGQ